MNDSEHVPIDPEALRRLRAASGLRQADLAVLAGIDASYLSMLETGRRRRPSRAVAARLAEALGVHARTFTRDGR